MFHLINQERAEINSKKNNREETNNASSRVSISWYHGHLAQTQEDQYVNQQHFVE
jgi:hypothetical protein